MLWNLLSSSSEKDGGKDYSMLIMIGIFALVIIVFMVFSKRSQKKRQQEAMDTLNALQPGNKVKTIGGICGLVVEVCDDNTFVMETGTEASGKSYLKLDKQAVYQTDALVKSAPAEQPAAAPAEEVFEAEASEKPAEAPVEETVTEEKTEE